MPFNVKTFSIAKAIDLPPGALLTYEGNWYLRVVMKKHLDDPVEAIFPLSEGAEYCTADGNSCMTLAPSVSFEFRIIGAIKGPGRAVPGALAWSAAAEPVLISKDNFVVSCNGFQSKDLHPTSAFYAPHWGVWLIDQNGKQIGSEPLFMTGAEG